MVLPSFSIKTILHNSVKAVKIFLSSLQSNRPELISPYLGGRPFRYQYFSLKNVLMMRDIDLFELNIPTP